MKNIGYLFEHTERLPAIPEVVRELILSFSDADVDTRKVAAKIALDQVISARVLKAANSARFGLSRQVASLNDAMLVMGFNTLRTLVVASGLVKAVKGPPGFDLKGYWKLSAATAGYAGSLAKQLRQRQDLAYTAGLILHIGILLIHQEMPAEAQAIEQVVVTGTERTLAEEDVLGYNHADVGAELASRWNFPPEITQALKAYPKPLEAQEFFPLGGVLHLADLIAARQMDGADRQGMKPDWPAELLKRLGFDADELLASLPPHAEVSGGLDELLG